MRYTKFDSNKIINKLGKFKGGGGGYCVIVASYYVF